MQLLLHVLGFILHVDAYLGRIIAEYGVWTYLLLFLILFFETGLVVTPFLPGDSLLFAAGIFAAKGALHVHTLFFLLALAAVAGDTVNYWIGLVVGPAVFRRKKSRLLNPDHLERAHRFYEKHGGKTIILARFMPIIRTFAPFVAGIAKMSYSRFLMYNVVGGVAWVALFVYGGYLFNGLPMVEENFSLVILIIIFLSILPPLWEYFRHRRAHSSRSNS